MPEDNPDPLLPPPTVEAHALGHLVRVLETRLPGVLDAWVDSLEDEAMLSEIIRLRAPRDRPEVRRVRNLTAAWAQHVRVVTLAMLGKARGKRRRP